MITAKNLYYRQIKIVVKQPAALLNWAHVQCYCCFSPSMPGCDAHKLKLEILVQQHGARDILRISQSLLISFANFAGFASKYVTISREINFCLSPCQFLAYSKVPQRSNLTLRPHQPLNDLRSHI